MSITVSECKVELLNVYGTEIDILNAARGSFGKKTAFLPDGTLKPADKSLISFLARGYTKDEWETIVMNFQSGTIPKSTNGVWNSASSKPKYEDVEIYLKDVRSKATHFMPFCHVFASFSITCPIFITRQLAKHQIGLAWSEESRRYIDGNVEIYIPTRGWRSRPEGSIKQGSGSGFITEVNDVGYPRDIDQAVLENAEGAINLYNMMIDNLVSPEQARMVLPLQMMTTYTWSGSLLAFARVANLRLDSHAQLEVREDVVRKMSDLLKPYFPNAWPDLVVHS